MPAKGNIVYMLLMLKNKFKLLLCHANETSKVSTGSGMLVEKDWVVFLESLYFIVEV